MTDPEDQVPQDVDIRQNAGRCDLCGNPIEMENGDTFETLEFNDEVTEQHGIPQNEQADAIARALESINDTVEDRVLAEVLREKGNFGLHGDCLDDTSYGQLETGDPDAF